MDLQALLQVVSALGDLELAVLLSLIAKEHCLVCVDDASINDLTAELSLIASERFRLSHSVVPIESLRSVESFVAAILDDNVESDSEGYDHDLSENDFENPFASHSRINRLQISASQRMLDRNNLDVRKVVNVIIAPDFNLAPKDVQIQALELIRKGRVYSRTTLHQAPKTFMFIPVTRVSTRHVRLISHLNDKMFISHFHGGDHGFANLEELGYPQPVEDQHSDSSKTKSMISRHTSTKSSRPRLRKNVPVAASHRYPNTDNTQTIDQLRMLSNAVALTPEIRRYLHDIVVFLRMERGVDGGITPNASNQFVALTKYLAALHGIDFVTPSIIALAAKKIYPHRIIVATPERERSTQYGTGLHTAKAILEDITPDSIVDSVLNTVACPL